MSDTSKWPQIAKDTAEVPKEALHSFAYTLLQSPVSALVQVVDKATGTNILPHVQIIDAPVKAEFQSPSWYAQQIGGAAGMMVFLNKVMKFRLGGTATREATHLTAAAVPAWRSNTAHILKSARVGALYEGVFRPVDDSHGPMSALDLVAAKAGHGLIGAATFGTMSAASRGFAAAGVKQEVLNGALSGIPAGLVSAEGVSRIRGDGPASYRELYEAGFGMAVVGGFFGGLEARTRVKSQNAQNRAAAELSTENGRTFRVVEGHESLNSLQHRQSDLARLEVREILSGGKLSPKRSLVAEHVKDGTPASSEASKADMSVSCNPERAGSPANHIFRNNSGPVWMRRLANDIVLFANAPLAPAPNALQLGDRRLMSEFPRDPRLTPESAREPKIEASFGQRVEGLKGSAEGVLRNAGLYDYAAALPKSWRSLRALGLEGNGNDSKVILLDNAVIKLSIGEWKSEYGDRPGDTPLISPVTGKLMSVREGTLGNNIQLWMYGQRRLDPTEPGQELLQTLDQSGLRISDKSGSGAQTGYNRATGREEVIDYFAVTQKNSNENRTLEEIQDPRIIEEEYDAESKQARSGKEVVEQREGVQEIDTLGLMEQQRYTTVLDNLAISQSRGEALPAKWQIPKSLRTLPDPIGSWKYIAEQISLASEGTGITNLNEIVELYSLMNNGNTALARKQVNEVGEHMKAAGAIR